MLRTLGADLVFKMPIVSTMARKGGAKTQHAARAA